MELVDQILAGYAPLTASTVTDFTVLGTESLPFPFFPQSTLSSLCDICIPILKAQPSLLRLDAPLTIVGDLHGNIRDLLRIFLTAKLPPATSYLFLGDYVDRGEYSVEVFVLLLALLAKYQDRVFLLRGNHEFRDICANYGFRDEILTLYQNDTLFTKFLSVMDVLPIAAVVNNSIFCVHGGLSPALTNLSQIEEIQRPPQETRLLIDLVWSDPANVTRLFCESKRGTGCLWGIDATKKFLEDNQLKHIVRAHEFIEEGIKKWNQGRGYTVFSTCNYKFSGSNVCGILSVCADGSIQETVLPVLERLPRYGASFTNLGGQSQAPRGPVVQFRAGRRTMLGAGKVTVVAPDDSGAQAKAPAPKPSMFGRKLRQSKAQSIQAKIKRTEVGRDLPAPGSPHPSENSGDEA